MEKKVTLEILNQKFDSYIEYAREKLDSIEKQTKETNCKIAEAKIKIAEIETLQNTCPARVNYEEDKKANREWIMWVPTLISVGIAIILFFEQYFNK